jgi:hypothetical protein
MKIAFIEFGRVIKHYGLKVKARSIDLETTLPSLTFVQ